MKHVKTYIIGGLIGSMCLAYTSCDSKLDQVNPNQATEATFWKDEADFELALTSC